MAKPDPKAGRRHARKLTPARKMRKKALANSSKRVRSSHANATSQAQLIEYLYLNEAQSDHLSWTIYARIQKGS